ncbi:MAG: hypothetical protein ACPLRN_01920 [Microgenomates group bacterium]
MNSMISPFNLVSFLSLISILSLIYISTYLHERKIHIFYYVLFILSTILAFYSDYSFFFTIPLYFLLILNTLKKSNFKNLPLFICLEIILIFVIPGFYQFINNTNKIKQLFPIAYKDLGLVNFINIISNYLFLRQDEFFLSSLIMLIIIFTPHIFLKKDYILKNFYFYLLIALIINFFIQFFISKYMFSLIIERSFWFLNFIIVLLISINVYILIKENNYFLKLISIALLLLPLFSNINKNKIWIGIKEEINYKQIKELNENKKIFFIIIDNEYGFYPITNYYLSKNFTNTKNNFYLLRKFDSEKIINLIKNNLNKKQNKIILVLINQPNYYYEMLKYKEFFLDGIKIYNLVSKEGT